MGLPGATMAARSPWLQRPHCPFRGAERHRRSQHAVYRRGKREGSTKSRSDDPWCDGYLVVVADVRTAHGRLPHLASPIANVRRPPAAGDSCRQTLRETLTPSRRADSEIDAFGRVRSGSGRSRPGADGSYGATGVTSGFGGGAGVSVASGLGVGTGVSVATDSTVGVAAGAAAGLPVGIRLGDGVAAGVAAASGVGVAAGVETGSGSVGPGAEKTCRVPPCRSSVDAEAVEPVRTTTLTKLSHSQCVSDGRLMPLPSACVAFEAHPRRS